MKNIYDIMTECGITLPEEMDKAAFEKTLYANYKSVEEFKKKDDAITSLTDQLNTAKTGLKAFEGVNVEELRGQVTKLTSDLEAKDTEWRNKMAAREFDYAVDGAILSAKGKNAKAIKALLDMDTLRTSTDMTKDVSAAIETVKKENSYLFEEEEIPGAYAGGTGTGKHTQTKTRFGNDKQVNAFARAVGLDLEEKKKGN
ncbi:MAG: phage scaffolding protein [Bacteroidales bacterium]|nr:phage scaffolding protein [Candidatus Equimonas faecalis]